MTSRPIFKPVILAALLSASALAMLSACGAPAEDAAREATTLHRGNSAEPLSLDPHLAQGTWENNIIGDMFMGLYTKAADGSVVYGLAQSHTVSEDGLTWTFKLRDANWSDGKAITASDFTFGLQRILTPDTLSQYAFMLYPIVGAEAINKGEAEPATLGVRAVDAKTFEIKLNTPTPFLPGLLTHYTSFAVPQHAVEIHGSAWTKPENIVVSNAFKLEKWRANDFVHVVKNDAFWDASNVCLSDIYYYPTNDVNSAMRRVATGELHINNEIPGKKITHFQKELPGYVRLHPWLYSGYVAFNTKTAPFDDTRVTRALSMALDREFLMEVIQGGRIPAYSLVPPGIDNYVASADAPKPDWASQSIETRRAAAKALLVEAGFGPDKPFNFEYSHRNTGDNPLAAPVFQESWNAIAPWVSVTLQSVETQIHYDNLRSGNFQVGDAAWVADYNDPQNYLFLLEARTGQMNYGRYSNPKYDALLEKSSHMLDLSERAKVLAKAEAMMLADMPIAPTWFDSNRNLVNPMVTGWVGNVENIHRSRFLCLDGAK